MSNYLFLSWCNWGHIDLGGFGFFRTAEELVRRGNTVHWMFTDTPVDPAIVQLVENAGIHIIRPSVSPLALSGFVQDMHNVSLSVKAAAREVANNNIDVLAADRTVALAGLVAEYADIPYASVGTDGRQWRRMLTRYRMPFISPMQESTFVNEALWSWFDLAGKYDARLSSDWLISPYLNISFFPYIFYEAENIHAPEFPSHFVGCSPTDRVDKPKRNILLTMGNSFNPRAAPVMYSLLNKISQVDGWLCNGGKVICLTGDESLTRRLQQEYDENPILEFITWDNYAEVFAQAILALGHGGSSFTWECIRAKIPSIVISPHVSDQFYNSSRSGYLGISKIIELEDLNYQNINSTIDNTLSSSDISNAINNINQAMFKGGGVRECASLLENLAATGVPLYECINKPCCC